MPRRAMGRAMRRATPRWTRHNGRRDMTSRFSLTLLAFLAGCLGIALYSLMDAVMKGLALAMGAYTTMVWRSAVGAGLSGAVWMVGKRQMPPWPSLRLHILRGVVMAVMALLFFHSITLLPLAEAIALSFIAPLIALYLAAVLLKERVGRAAIAASVLGILGVAVIVFGRVHSDAANGTRSWEGVTAVLASAVLYAYNLVLARKQAQIAPPAEVAFFQNLVVCAVLLPAVPWLLKTDVVVDWPMVVLAAALSVCSLFIMTWAYARAEAQVLIPDEYTAFVWAAICGWVFFNEVLTVPVLAGTALIVTGCLISAHASARKPPQPVA